MQYAFIVQMLLIIAVPIVKMVLRAIGFAVVSYVGFNLLIDQARSYLMAEMGSVAVPVQQILGLAKIDVAINMYLAAVTTRALMAGWLKAQDRLRRQVWNPPGRDYIDA